MSILWGSVNRDVMVFYSLSVSKVHNIRSSRMSGPLVSLSSSSLWADFLSQNRQTTPNLSSLTWTERCHHHIRQAWISKLKQKRRWARKTNGRAKALVYRGAEWWWASWNCCSILSTNPHRSWHPRAGSLKRPRILLMIAYRKILTKGGPQRTCWCAILCYIIPTLPHSFAAYRNTRG